MFNTANEKNYEGITESLLNYTKVTFLITYNNELHVAVKDGSKSQTILYFRYKFFCY